MPLYLYHMQTMSSATFQQTQQPSRLDSAVLPVDDVFSQPFFITLTKGVVGAGVAGSFFGMAMASWKGRSKLTFSLNMGFAWGVVAIPFFVTRQYMLLHRRPLIATRDKEDLIASASSGAVVGSVLGFLYRGPIAIPAGIIAYSGLAAAGQYLWTRGRHYRQRVGLKYEVNAPEPVPYRMLEQPFISGEELEAVKRGGIPSAGEKIDPLWDMWKWFSGWMKDRGYFTDPENDDKSPSKYLFLRSLDDAYKVHLNSTIYEKYDELIYKRKQLRELKRRHRDAQVGENSEEKKTVESLK